MKTTDTIRGNNMGFLSNWLPGIRQFCLKCSKPLWLNGLAATVARGGDGFARTLLTQMELPALACCLCGSQRATDLQWSADQGLGTPVLKRKGISHCMPVSNSKQLDLFLGSCSSNHAAPGKDIVILRRYQWGWNVHVHVYLKSPFVLWIWIAGQPCCRAVEKCVIEGKKTPYRTSILSTTHKECRKINASFGKKECFWEIGGQFLSQN